MLHLVGYFCMSYAMMYGSTNMKLINELGNQHSLVNIRSRLQARRSGVWTQAGKREFPVLQQRPHWPWSSSCLLFNGYWCLYSLKKTVWGVRLTRLSI
jgi:hypothetical protein